MYAVMIRFYIIDLADFNYACSLLDDTGISYDLDSWDRIMVEDDYYEDVVSVFDGNNIDYEEI